MDIYLHKELNEKKKVKVVWRGQEPIKIEEGICEFCDSHMIKVGETLIPMHRVIKIEIIKENKKE